jgi:hypothetical protein
MKDSDWYQLHDALVDALEGRPTSHPHSLVSGVQALAAQVRALEGERDAKAQLALDRGIELAHRNRDVRDAQAQLARAEAVVDGLERPIHEAVALLHEQGLHHEAVRLGAYYKQALAAYREGRP